MTGSSFIALDREAVQNNITFLKKKIGKNTRISAVVKANAYGHGIEQMVPLFEEEGIDHFSVFDFPEAMRVYKSRTRESTIMIMGWISDTDLEATIDCGLEFFVFNVERLTQAIDCATKLNTKAKIHLNVETGMNRLGLETCDLKEVIRLIEQHHEVLDIRGVCTHLAGPESVANYKRIINQLKRFNQILSFLSTNEITPEYRHVSNSAAAFVYPKAKMNLVRIGIMLYGFWSSPETFMTYTLERKNKTDPLKRILSWQSSIMSLKTIKEGEFVGYGNSYLTQKEAKVAIVPIGYSIGYNRSLSNKGRVLVNGCRCGVIGMVNMNMIMVDVTDVEDPKVGDEVVIIGWQNGLEIKVSSFSNISNELNYEILAHLPQRIERIVH
jgi:alanine racemase